MNKVSAKNSSELESEQRGAEECRAPQLEGKGIWKREAPTDSAFHCCVQ